MTIVGALSRHRFLATVAFLLVLAAVSAPVGAGDGIRTVAAGFSPPTAALPLGTDGLGRDVMARLLAGGRDLVVVAGVATALAVIVGVALGLITSRPGGLTSALRWILDVVLVVPAMLTMLVLIFGIGPGVLTVVIITAAISAPFVARFVRSLARPLLSSEFVLIARSGGDSSATIFGREVLPVLAGPIAADAGARFVGAVYLVASASFLGFDPLGSSSDWAAMVQSGLAGIALNPWAALEPALAIALITVPANLLVDRVLREVTQ